MVDNTNPVGLAQLIKQYRKEREVHPQHQLVNAQNILFGPRLAGQAGSAVKGGSGWSL